MNQWTVMVYMAGDNNLSLDMAYTLESIKNVTKGNGNIKLYVYFDSFSRNVPTLYCEFSGKDKEIKFYRSQLVPDKLMLVENEFNENSAAIENIVNFVDWCVKKDIIRNEDGTIDEVQSKNRNYAFIFSGHTFSFLDWGLYKDENAESYMTLSKLRWMFSRITATKDTLQHRAEEDEAKYKAENPEGWSEEYRRSRTTEIIGKKLALIGFDSCEMSAIEIASQFNKVAEMMVASEGSVPNSGWNYAQILLGKIKDKATADPATIAVDFVEEFIKQQSKFALADISVDMSAWNLSEVDKLNEAVEQLATKLLNCLSTPQSPVYNQILRILTHVHWQCQTYLLEQLVDLGDFCQLMAREIDLLRLELRPEFIEPLSAVGDACRNVIEKLKKCILVTGFSGSDFQFSNGISIFFPWSYACYETAEEDYQNLSFIKNFAGGQKWNEFLVKYLKEATFRPSRALTLTDQNGNILISSDTRNVVFNSYFFADPATTKPSGSSSAVTTENTPKEGTKRPPNEFRRPPNSFKSASAMNIFLSRFMRLKNFEPNWNRTGFSGSDVDFVNENNRTSSPVPNVGAEPVPAKRPQIVVPRSNTIFKPIEKFLLKLEEFQKSNPTNHRIGELIHSIKSDLQNFDNPSKIDILEKLIGSDLFKDQ